MTKILNEILKKGDAVTVPYKGKMVKGKVIRYDKGGPEDPFYVVDVGENESPKIPAHKIKEEYIKEDWLDKELRKVEMEWMKRGPDGKFLYDKGKKMKWLDKMDVKAEKNEVSDHELEKAMADYGIGHKLKWYTPDGGYTTEGGKQGLLDVKERHEAENMNRYVAMLQNERHVNLWAEAKRISNVPEPVDGKKTLTGKAQQRAIINPKEKGGQ